MKYYKDKNNTIYAYASNTPRELFEKLTIDKTAISEDEAKKMLEPAITIEELQDRLMSLCSIKTKEIARIILGYKATDEQIATYEAKYQEALRYRDDNTTTVYFNDTKEKCDEIIAKGEAFTNMKMELIAKIEKFRIYVDDLISDGKLTEAKELIDNGIELL